MAIYYPATPFVPVFTDDDGTPLSGGKLIAYLRGTSTQTPVYSDTSGTSLGATVTLNARGEPKTSGNATCIIHLDASISYKFELQNASASQKWALDSIQASSVSYLIADRVNTLAALQALTTSNYSAGDTVFMASRSTANDGAQGHFTWTTGDQSANVAADEVTGGEGDGPIWVAPASDKTGASGAWQRAYDHGVSRKWSGISSDLPAGTTIGLDTRETYTSDSGGTTDIRNVLVQSQLGGANSTQQVVTHAFQSEYRHTAGTVTFGHGIQGYNRLGLSGSTTGDITACRGVEWHTANEGSGEIDTALNFYSQAVDLADGTGNILNMIGFLCADQGHATRVTTAAIAFDAANFTAGAPLTAAFRSQMTSGTGKFSFYGGSAPSVQVGGWRIGDTTSPTDKLEVKGYAKLSVDGTVTATGSYHEINSTQSDYVVHVKNTHASTPQGLRLRFTAAAPDNNTQEFLRCEDSSTSRLIIYSDGDIVNHDNSYGAISDLNLKTDINDADSVLEKFRERRFVSYRLKSDVEAGKDKVLRGVIAQEEENISPDLVKRIEIEKPVEVKNEYGDIELLGESKSCLSYNYAGMAIEAGQAIKELLAIVDKQQKQIAALSEKIEAL